MLSHFRQQVEEMILIPSGGGVFEITVNDQKLYSKKETGVFPDVIDIIAKMEALT